MVGQHFDNVWIYTKDIANKFNADNRLDYGISKDLVADAIKDFGVKLYSNNFNTNDLYTAFLGITPSGNSFPYTKDQSFSFPINDRNSELITSPISASNTSIPLDETNKRLYKRIYHNIPYLLKTKGTIAGLRALITSYGIPDTILDINEFGDQNISTSENWELEQNIFNYKLDVGNGTYFSSSIKQDSDWENSHPRTIQFRFKTNGTPSSTLNQTLFAAGGNQTVMTLQYTGSSNTTGSYSGSIANPEKNYGTVTLYPQGITANAPTASIYLPVFDGNWWSVMATLDYNESDDVELYVSTKDNNQLGHYKKSVTTMSLASYTAAEDIQFPYNTTLSGYAPFTGSIQEIRFYDPVLSESAFKDYTMNPYSYVGNSRDTVANELSFRSSLGSLLDTGSLTSIHPKITGSYITSSFSGSVSNYYIISSSFSSNNEIVYFNQPPAGIKNKITDKITVVDNTLPSGDTLSPLQSIEQISNLPDNSTPNSNYLEVAFSPTNEVDKDIISQLGNFNIGDYIGDPRSFENDDKHYSDLDKLRNTYFEKYIKGYNVRDFIRLIKFFDNSLFKMIKDFTPARTGLSSGVVVKQNILERNKQRRAKVSFLDRQYTGSLKSYPQNYNSGSVYKEEGQTGGSFERYAGSTNNHNVTQSWTEYRITPSGSLAYTRDDQREFYNGEFSGSKITPKLQRGDGINDPCFAYYTWNGIPQYLYRMSFISGSDDLYSLVSSSTIPDPFELDDLDFAHSGNFDVNYLGEIQRIKTDNAILVGTASYFDSIGSNPDEFYIITGSDTVRTASFQVRVPNKPTLYRNYNQIITLVTHSVQEAAPTLTFSMITGSTANSASGFEVNINGNITSPTIYTASLFNVVYSESVSNNYYFAITSSLTRTAHITASVPIGYLNQGEFISGSVTDLQEDIDLVFVYLGYDISVETDACNNIDQIYRLDSEYLMDATIIYTQNNDPSTGEITRASAGYYSDGNVVRYFDGINLGSAERCNLYL